LTLSNNHARLHLNPSSVSHLSCTCHHRFVPTTKSSDKVYSHQADLVSAQLIALADTYKCLCRVEECGKEFAKPETRTALLALASSCRIDSHCIAVCRAIRNLTLSTAGQRLFSHIDMRDGFLRMAACISSDDGREAWSRAVCRHEPGFKTHFCFRLIILSPHILL
jgi:hypothetical protein